MSITLECPACEEQFQVAEDSRDSVQHCPACRLEFCAGDAVVALDPQPAGSASQSPASSTSPPKLKPPSRKPSISAPPNASFDLHAVPLESSKPGGQGHRFHVSAPGLGARYRAKTGLSWLIKLVLGVVAVGAVLIMAALISLLANANRRDQPTVAKKDSGGSAVLAQPKLSPSAQKAQRRDEMPQTFSLAQLEQVWGEVYGYLVKLTIYSALGTTEATGFIVDSRGWVATSFGAIKDAYQVDITLAAKPLRDGEPLGEQSDRARGIIAVDEKSDLAILAMNRSLVLKITDLPLVRSDAIVGGQRLLAARYPGDQRRIWLAETRVDRRSRFDPLPAAVQSTAQWPNPEEGNQLEWIVHSLDDTAHAAGAPLLDAQGSVVALNSSLGSEGEGFAVPIGRLIDLRASSSDQARPFEGQRAVADHQPAGASEAFVPAGADRPADAQAAVAALEEAFQQCNLFGWLPRNEQDYAQFRSLSGALYRVLQITNAAETAEAQKQLLDQRVNDILTAIDDKLPMIEEAAPEQIQLFNQLFEQSGGDRDPSFILIGRVKEAAITSPRIQGELTVTFQLDGVDQPLIAPLTEDDGRLRPGTRWMLFGQVEPGVSYKVAREGGFDQAIVATLAIAIQLEKRPQN